MNAPAIFATELQKAAASTWTPKRIHTLADHLGVPWDNDPHFMDFSQQVVGKKHLDDMSADELKVLAGALVRTCHTAECS